MSSQEVNAVASNEEMPTFGSEGSADEGQNVDITKRSFIPCEILSLIFSYVMVDVVDGEMIRKIGVLRELGSDFVEAIAENVKQLNVGSLLQGYKGNKSGYVSHLSNNIEQIVTIFPKLERVFLDGLSELKQSQLEYLLNNLSLKEISLKGCLLINQFTCSDFTQLEKITVDRENIALRSSLYKEIVHSVYIEKPQTLVKVPNGINCFLKTLAGASNELELSSRDTIHDVKMIFEGYSGIPADQQRMIFAGKRLADDRCLYDYGCINAGSTIHVVFRLRGGAGSNLSDIPNYNLIQFSPKEELNSFILYEHDEFKVLELDIFNGATCEILTKDILYEKRNNFDYNITPHLSNPFKKYLNTTVIPYLNNLRAFQRKIQEVQDIFVVHYSPQEDEDLILHTDPSYITLNICVHTSQDFGGNEIDLITQNEQQVGELVAEYGCGQDVDQNNNFTYRRVTPTIGKALVHLGSHPHKTLKITNGNRFNIVCWLK